MMNRIGGNGAGEDHTVLQPKILHLLFQTLQLRPSSNDQKTGGILKQGEEKKRIDGAVHPLFRGQPTYRNQDNMLRIETETASDPAAQLLCDTQRKSFEVDAAWQHLDWFGYSIALKHRFMGG